MVNSYALRLYHASPSPLRSFLATMRGLELRFRRYGRETDSLIEAAAERERWSPQAWKDWQETALEEILNHAATTVPYYRNQWASRRAHGDRSSWSELENWPILEKDEIRQNPRAFLSERPKIRHLYLEHTSGTTGKPLELWFSRWTLRQYYALYDCRVRRWNGVSRKDRHAILGAQPVVPADSCGPPYWVRNLAMNQLYLSAHHISPTTVTAYYRVLQESHVTHIIGYPSSLSYMAAQGTAQDCAPPTLRAIITNAEPLFDWQRVVIERGLGVRPREMYGMTEMVVAASECEAGSLHLWPEVGYMEVVDSEGKPAVEGEQVGELVCTGLLSREMPLVRYAVGDRVARSQSKMACSCGRTLPMIERIEGRNADMLVGPDGRRVFGVSSVFYGLPIVESQIIQEATLALRVLVVPSLGFGTQSSAAIASRLRQRVGDVAVNVELVTSVPRGPNGKFKPVVNLTTAT